MERKNIKLLEIILIVALIAIGISFATVEVYSSTKKNSSSNEFRFKTSEAFQDTSYSQKGRDLLEQFSLAFEASAAKISPSVVPIFAEETKIVQNPFGLPGDQFKGFFGQDFFKQFFGGSPQQKETVHSLGSGVIVTADGYILTNNHVVQGANKLTVVLNDKKRYTAKIVGTDPLSDVAVIKIEATNLPVATLGNSDNVKIGQWVIAVGNPFELMHTVTTGIISATGRSAVGLAEYEDFMQTDAAINPGNSGGALADLDGNVIGINTAISSPSGGNVGIGFAIPINMAKSIMTQLIKNGKISRGYLAVNIQDVTDDLAKALNLKNSEGALVANVANDGPADKAGIKRGDVIIDFNNKKVANSTDLKNMVAQTEPGSTVPVTIIRDNNQKKLDVKIGERPNENNETASSNESGNNNSKTKVGISVQNLTSDIAKQLGYEGQQGVLVVAVQPGSPAENAGIQVKDLIQEVNQKKVTSVNQLEDIISGLKKGDSAALLIRRGNATFYVAVTIG